MIPKFKLHESLENAFLVGLLLTGSIERAETAVIESVKPPCPDDLFSEALFRRVLHDSVETQPSAMEAEQREELKRAASILPFELQCVLSLPEHLRHSYVLRMLVGLSREVCAWLQHLETWQVDQYTSTATLALPLIQQRQSLHQSTAQLKYCDDDASHSSSIRWVSREKQVSASL